MAPEKNRYRRLAAMALLGLAAFERGNAHMAHNTDDLALRRRDMLTPGSHMPLVRREARGSDRSTESPPYRPRYLRPEWQARSNLIFSVSNRVGDLDRIIAHHLMWRGETTCGPRATELYRLWDTLLSLERLVMHHHENNVVSPLWMQLHRLKEAHEAINDPSEPMAPHRHVQWLQKQHEYARVTQQLPDAERSEKILEAARKLARTLRDEDRSAAEALVDTSLRSQATSEEMVWNLAYLREALHHLIRQSPEDWGHIKRALNRQYPGWNPEARGVEHHSASMEA